MKKITFAEERRVNIYEKTSARDFIDFFQHVVELVEEFRKSFIEKFVRNPPKRISDSINIRFG